MPICTNLAKLLLETAFRRKNNKFSGKNDSFCLLKFRVKPFKKGLRGYGTAFPRFNLVHMGKMPLVKNYII